MAIKFGTDGWRAVISDEFTFANVRQVAQALADFILEQQGIAPRQNQACPNCPPVVIGYDTRFLSDRYATQVASVIAGNGISVYVSKSDCPTPALSFAVKTLGASMGVMITASHNPPRYNGIKVKASYGGAAMPSDTAAIEAHLAKNLRDGVEARQATWKLENGELAEGRPAWGSITRLDCLSPYLDHLRTLVDFPAIARSGLRVVSDPMYGAGRGYIPHFLQEMGCEVKEIRGELNPGFGGIHPEPIEQNLGALIQTITEGGYDVGLATDGDADRIGAVDDCGHFVDPHRIFALTLRHLVEVRGWQGAIVKTISTTQLINRLAERYGLPLFETPVGFNYISDLMLKEDVLIGGEESGGISIKGHIPEGDGLLMGLLLLEIIATQRKPLHVIIDELMDDVGHFYYSRRDRRTRPFDKAEMVKQLMNNVPVELGNMRVMGVNNSDGVKYHLADGSWLLLRPSGTEPVLRIYAEATHPALVQELLDAGERLAEIGR